MRFPLRMIGPAAPMTTPQGRAAFAARAPDRPCRRPGQCRSPFRAIDKTPAPSRFESDPTHWSLLTMGSAVTPSPSAAQLDAFKVAVRSHIGWLSVTPADSRSFSASLRHASCGFLDFVKLDCEPILVERTPGDIVGDSSRDFLLALQVEGTGVTRQNGREVTLQPGDFSIVDSTMPYALQFDGPVKRIVLRLPRTELKRRGRISQNICCRAYRGATGTSGMASNMMISMEQHCRRISPMMHQSLASTLLDLILFSEAEDMAEASPLSQSSEATLQRLRAVVLTHLSDPDLSAERAAALTGISVRYAHKLFSSTGTSLNRWIQQERLAACHRCLGNPAHAHRSITEIALSNGFNDSGYFSQLFSRRYGISPSKLRSASRPGPATPAGASLHRV